MSKKTASRKATKHVSVRKTAKRHHKPKPPSEWPGSLVLTKSVGGDFTLVHTGVEGEAADAAAETENAAGKLSAAFDLHERKPKKTK